MNLNNFDEFRRRGAKKALRDTSYDDNHDEYMTTCDKIVIDFDQAKTNYCNKLGISEEFAASADSLCKTATDKYYLIEFKNGSIDPKNIQQKAKDSVAILSGITSTDLNTIREMTTFILVYNGNAHRIDDKHKKALALANKGQNDFTLFGLGKLRGLYFQKVHVIEMNAFNKSAYIRNIQSI